MVNQN